ncbi:MAG: hypothetical protein WBV73_08160 [Phormidium sp.]
MLSCNRTSIISPALRSPFFTSARNAIAFFGDGECDRFFYLFFY